MNADVDDARVLRAPDNAVLEGTGEKFWKDRDDVESHSRGRQPWPPPRRLQIQQSFGWIDHDAPRIDVDLGTNCFDKRDERVRAAVPNDRQKLSRTRVEDAADLSDNFSASQLH